MSETSEEWELSKENIRPIQQGRKQKALKVALAAHPEDTILQQRQSFENELRTYSGDDPLFVWYEYIHWVEQNFPKGGREGHIKELIERCLAILKNEKKYYDDDRFIDIMLKYATVVGKPIDVYNYMFSNNIGCKSAKLFIDWSWLLEQMGNMKKADEILNEGFRHLAKPYEKLYSYYKDFEIRLASKIKANMEQDDFEPENSRSAFAMLKPQKKNLAPISRTGAAVVENQKMPLILGRQQPQPKSISASVKVPFSIYNSENIHSSLPVQSQCKIPSAFTSKSYKENEQKAGKWNKVKVKPHGLLLKTPSEVKPEFEFHCDDDTELDFQTPRSVPCTSKILTTRCRSPTTPMAFFESSDPLIRNMYPKNKIYGGAEEFCLEEIRAAEWFERKKKTGQEILIKLQEGIEQNSETKTHEIDENLAEQVLITQSHSPNSIKSQLNSTDNIVSDKIPNTEKVNENSQCKMNKNSEPKDNTDSIFSIKSNLLTSFNLLDSSENGNSACNESAKIIQNVCNGTKLQATNDTLCSLSSSNLLGKKSAICSNIWPNIKEGSKNEKVEKTSQKSKNILPFELYLDPENE